MNELEQKEMPRPDDLTISTTIALEICSRAQVLRKSIPPVKPWQVNHPDLIGRNVRRGTDFPDDLTITISTDRFQYVSPAISSSCP